MIVSRLIDSVKENHILKEREAVPNTCMWTTQEREHAAPYTRHALRTLGYGSVEPPLRSSTQQSVSRSRGVASEGD
jgi:hypothetical protein